MLDGHRARTASLQDRVPPSRVPDAFDAIFTEEICPSRPRKRKPWRRQIDAPRILYFDLRIEMASGSDLTTQGLRGLAVAHGSRRAAGPFRPVSREPGAISCDMTNPRLHADFTESRFCHEERIAPAIEARRDRTHRWRGNLRERDGSFTCAAMPAGRRVAANNHVTG